MSKERKREEASSQAVDSFIRSIQALNFNEMKKYLKKYGGSITNRLESRTRLPSVCFAIGISDQRTGLECLKELIKAGASLSFRDPQGNTFLHYACKPLKTSIVKYLLQRKMKVNDTNIYRQSILFIAAKRNCLEVMQHLAKLQDQIDVNTQDVFGRTPIFYAAEQGNREICELLIKLGAKIDIADSDGHSALYYAKKWQRSEVIRTITPVKLTTEEEEEEVLVQFTLLHLGDDLNTTCLTVGEVEALLRDHPDLTPLLTSPERMSVPPDFPLHGWQKKARKMVRTCLKNEGSEFFKQPVNEQIFGINDYYKVITHPMDFGSILTKLTYNGYRNSQEFVNDVQLIFSNCLYYNGPEHYVSKCAKDIKRLFESICDFD